MCREGKILSGVNLNILTTLSKYELTLTLGSVRLVHIAISSRTLISGYRFLVKRASSSCNCWLVKWVRWRRCLLLFLSFFPTFDSSNWLSGLSGLWLGSSWPGSKKENLFLTEFFKFQGVNFWLKLSIDVFSCSYALTFYSSKELILDHKWLFINEFCILIHVQNKSGPMDR